MTFQDVKDRGNDEKLDDVNLPNGIQPGDLDDAYFVCMCLPDPSRSALTRSCIIVGLFVVDRTLTLKLALGHRDL